MKFRIAAVGILAFVLSASVQSQEAKHKGAQTHDESEEAHEHGNEDHDEDAHAHNEEKKDDHDHGESEAGHEHGEGDHEEEGGANVGPEKGILAASEKDGIKLSPEAFKNFEIRSQKISGPGPWLVPLSARLLSGEEVNLYRLRNGFFKRIDFTVNKKTAEQMTVSSSELKSGDEFVTGGIGFLRIAELAAFGGVAHGHSH